MRGDSRQEAVTEQPELPRLVRGRPVRALLPCPSLWGACPPISISGRVPISTLQTGSYVRQDEKEARPWEKASALCWGRSCQAG